MVPMTIEPWWQAILPDLMEDGEGKAIYGWLRSLGVVQPCITADECREAMIITLADARVLRESDQSSITLARYLHCLLGSHYCEELL